jgi:hypothetical protein
MITTRRSQRLENQPWSVSCHLAGEEGLYCNGSCEGNTFPPRLTEAAQLRAPVISSILVGMKELEVLK